MYNLELLENAQAKAKIELSGEEFKELKDKILSEFKNAKIDGFRKGHAPLDVIEKTFEGKINEEIFNYVLNTEIKKMLDEKKIEVLGQVNIEDHALTKENVVINISFEIKPNFELPQYKGLNIEEKEEKVTDEKIDEELKANLEKSKTIEKSEKTVAENNDLVNINFEGFVDGVAFEGGKAENYNLKLGSHSFIEGFEEQIVGHNVNDEFDVDVVFPEEYHSEKLKGKPALFKVKLNSIQVEKIPAADDDFAKKNGFDTLAEYKIMLKEQLENKYKNEAQEKKYQDIAEKLVQSTTMDLPKNIVAEETKGQKNALLQQLSMQGLDLNSYLGLSGKTEEEFNKEFEKRAENIVKFNLIIGKIAQLENIKVEKEDIDSELGKMASLYGMTKEQIIEELTKAKLLENYTNQIASSVFMKKMKEFLVENN